MIPAEASEQNNEHKLRFFQQNKLDSVPWEDPTFNIEDQVRMVHLTTGVIDMIRMYQKNHPTGNNKLSRLRTVI